MPRVDRNLIGGAGKVYAVFKGRQTGLFSNYEECRKQVIGFSGSVHKSFKTRILAESWLRERLDADVRVENIRLSKLYPDTNQNNQSFSNDMIGEEKGRQNVRRESTYHSSVSLSYSSLGRLTSPHPEYVEIKAQEEPIYIKSPPAPKDVGVTVNKVTGFDSAIYGPRADAQALEGDSLNDGFQLEPPPIPLSIDQERVLKMVLDGHNVFFTGPAGSGKSLILKHIQYHLKCQGKTFAVTAPTAIAADLIGGQTIHSWSRVGKGDKGIMHYLDLVQDKDIDTSHCEIRWRNTEVLIIDEVSMLSPDLFETLNNIAKASCFPGADHKKIPPFAAIQLVICGDFFQLPPVDKENDKKCFNCGLPVIPKTEREFLDENDPRIEGIPFHNRIHSVGVDPKRWTVCKRPVSSTICGHLWNETVKYCFQTSIWSKMGFRFISLTKVFRQTDETWVEMLRKIKMGEVDDEILDYLELLKKPLGTLESGIKPTKLYTHRKKVDQENEEEFMKLEGNTYRFNAVDTGRFMAEDHRFVRNMEHAELEEQYFFYKHSTPKIIRLKYDAQVMLLSNLSLPNRLVNGSRGVIRGFAFYDLPGLKKCANSSHWNWGKNYLSNLKTYFDHNNVYGLVRIPLVKFHSTARTLPILPVGWNTSITHFFKHPDGKPGRNFIELKRIQIPLMLAWATTIHKSQGMSLDYVTVDVRGAFAPGQTYVGLSRCRAPAGMEVLGGGWGLGDVFLVDKAVLKFNGMLERKISEELMDEGKEAEVAEAVRCKREIWTRMKNIENLYHDSLLEQD